AAALDSLEIEPLFLRLSALQQAILPQTSKAGLIGPGPKHVWVARPYRIGLFPLILLLQSPGFNKV
ncbi:hypothetical protein, partial [Novosphingobium sp.]|uniref:hypothetical protein n=1 Tax=Novosphingobium sp. TaxID=1874826 RepID=UPI003564B871